MVINLKKKTHLFCFSNIYLKKYKKHLIFDSYKYIFTIKTNKLLQKGIFEN